MTFEFSLIEVILIFLVGIMTGVVIVIDEDKLRKYVDGESEKEYYDRKMEEYFVRKQEENQNEC